MTTFRNLFFRSQVRLRSVSWFASVCLISSLLLSSVASLRADTMDTENPYNKFRNRDRGKGAMSQENELKFAEAAHQEIAKSNRFITDPSILNYVNEVGRRVAARSQRPNLPYQFYVIDNNQINAFTPGGGRVYIYSGLLKAMTSEGQLAAVFAHEIGHNVGYHVSDQIRRAQTVGIFASIAGALLGNGIVGDATRLGTALVANGYLFKRSRDAEREADYLGLYDMKDAGYNTQEMVSVFQLLETLGKKPGAIDKVFASHPPAAERLANTEREIADHLPGSDRQGIHSTSAFDTMKRRLGSATSGSLPSDNPSGRNPSTSGTSGGDVQRSAQQILDRIGERNATIVDAIRGDVTGNGDSDSLVVVYERNRALFAIVDLRGRTYDLKTSDRELSLPLQDVFKLRLKDDGGRTPQIVIVSTGRDRQRRRDFWRWDGRGFRYVGTDDE